jgi:hypothetical protein
MSLIEKYKLRSLKKNYSKRQKGNVDITFPFPFHHWFIFLIKLLQTFVILPFSIVFNISIRPSFAAPAMLVAILPVPNIFISIMPGVEALAMHFTILPVPFIFISMRPGVAALAMPYTILPVPNIFISSIPSLLALSMMQPIDPAAFIAGPIAEEDSLAVPQAILHFSLIQINQSSTDDDLSGTPDHKRSIVIYAGYKCALRVAN